MLLDYSPVTDWNNGHNKNHFCNLTQWYSCYNECISEFSVSFLVEGWLGMVGDDSLSHAKHV